MRDSRRLYSPGAKNCVCRWPSGPPSESADLAQRVVATSLPLAALALVKPESAAAVAAGRQVAQQRRHGNWLPPLLVTMLMALPVLPPYSAENAFVEHRHLLHRVQRDVAEDRLPSPAIVAGAAIHFEPRLPPAGAVGGEQILVHEHVALIDGRPIGCVEHRQDK